MPHFDEFFLEEQFHKKGRKDTKKQRKLLEKKDRSKHKKTDLSKKKQFQEKKSEEVLFKGRVLSIFGEKALISSDDTEYLCSLRGLLKKEITQNKNILAVGDLVSFVKENEDKGTIVLIRPRYSILARMDLLKKKQHLLAVNIDQVFITVSVVHPFLKPSLIDRYIIAAKRGGMTPIILVNKIDLLKGKNKEYKKEEIEKEKKAYKDFLAAYEKIGLAILSISCKTKKGIGALKNLMKNKASVFSGQSGCGKTSLVNAVLKMNLKTQKALKKTYKGSHTTTKAILLPLKDGGFCIDTPGIKSFGMWQLKEEEIKNYFQEFEPFSKKCKYPNCNHLEEPSCGVKKAVEKNKISLLRFKSYQNLMKNLKEEHKKR